MLDGIMDTLSTVFTITVIIVIVCVIGGIVKGISAGKELAERTQSEEVVDTYLLNTVMSESQQFSTDVLISQRDEVYRAYKELESCKRAGSLKTKEIVWIRVGDKFGCGMNLNTCYAVLQYLNREIERRG